jgi:hypothetical protein
MEVSQFTYFQQVGGHDCHPVSGELTYGLERLAMYVLGVDHVMDMPFNDPGRADPADLWRHLPPDRTGIFSRHNFDGADTAKLLRDFERAEAECQRLLAFADRPQGRATAPIVMVHPAYDQCIKASHLFNLLDARGVISVTERQAYIGRVRALAKACADAFVLTEAGGAALERQGHGHRAGRQRRHRRGGDVVPAGLRLYETCPAPRRVARDHRQTGVAAPVVVGVRGHRRRQLSPCASAPASRCRTRAN